MGSGKKKKNQAFQVAPAVDVESIALEQPGVSCAICEAMGKSSAATSMLVASSNLAACDPCESATLGGVSSVLVDPATGVALLPGDAADPSVNYVNISTDIYLSSTQAVNCPNCGQFMPANGPHSCAHTDVAANFAESVKMTASAAQIEQLANLHGGTWQDLTGEIEEDGGVSTYTDGTFDAPNGGVINITGFSDGTWEAAAHDVDGDLVGQGSGFSTPENAYSFAVSSMSADSLNVHQMSNPVIDKQGDNITATYADGGTLTAVLHEDASGSATYEIKDENGAVISTGYGTNLLIAENKATYALNKGISRCANCGQFMSATSAGSHVCPTATEQEKADAFVAADPLLDAAIADLVTDFPDLAEAFGEPGETATTDAVSEPYLTPEEEASFAAFTPEVPAPLDAAVDEAIVDSELPATGDAAVDLAVEQPAGSHLTGQEAVDFQSAHAEEVLTPIPAPGELTAGDGVGTHVVLGGSDFYDSAATLISYKDEKNPSSVRQVLFAEVTPEAEAKIIEALSQDTKMVEVQKEVTETGRIALDKENNVFEDIQTAAKSVNFHLKEQDEIPSHTLETIKSLQDRMKGIEQDADADPKAQEMAAHYKEAVDNLVAWRDNWDDKKAEFANSNGADGKMPKATEFVTEHTHIVKEMVAAPGGNGLPTTVENCSSIDPTLMPNGESHWSGKMGGSLGSGSQYKVDLGDGFTAYYRPHNGDHLKYGSPQKGTRGQLEIVGPAGVDDPEKLVRSLGRIHIGNQPLTQSEAEWSYLNANVFSQNLGGRAQVKQARAAGEIMVSARMEQIMSARMSEMLSLDDKGIDAWTKDVRLQAERESLTDRTAMLRDSVAKVSGFTSGAALLKSENYKPAPVVTRSGVKWRRFDITPEEIDKEWSARNRGLHHSISGNSERILDVLRTGSLASQARRRRIGVPNTGMSEGPDVNTGGSRSVFLRNWPASGSHHSSAGLHWDKPSALLSRTDWYANTGDGYGKMTNNRNPIKTVGFTSSNNEVMFADGIDIYGSEAPSRVRVPAHIRDKALQIVAEKGITHVNGTPVDQWIVS